ncbi:hypothetical protein V3C99_009747 [Haemonchus contortus]
MVNCHHTKGKRRRSGPLEGPQNKKSRYDDIEPCSANTTSEVENKDSHKRKRLRKRTKGLRELIKTKIEVALRKSNQPLTHLFTSVDDAGTPQAAFIDVIKLIGLSQEDWLKAASLSPKAAESISNITDMFRIERSPDNKLMLKYRATEWRIEDCTVYLDNLPPGCTSEKIGRFARKFGTVVEVRLPRSSRRPVSSSYGIIDVGRHSRSFAFVQFTEPEACRKMCEAFVRKPAPEPKKEECPSLVPLLQRLLFHIRTLAKRRRRRTYAQNILLMKLRRQQAAIIKMERTANKRTSKVSRLIDREKVVVAEEQSNGKTVPMDDHVDGEHNISNSECNQNRRLSFGKKKKPKGHRESTGKKTKRKKRRRRRKRRTCVGPHTIIGSLNDYFAKIQVFPFASYMELRKEYIALRRQSNNEASRLTRKDDRFSEFASRLCYGKLGYKLESYRDYYWNASMVDEE